MLGQPKGYVQVANEITHTRGPGVQYIPGSTWGKDLTPIYFSAMKGRYLRVMDVAVDGHEYMVLAEGPETGVFMWFLDKQDTVGEMEAISDPVEQMIEALRVVTGGRGER